MSISELTTVVAKLPDNLQQEVYDFASFLLATKVEKAPLTHVAGLHEGNIEMSDDFDEPLEDSFWLGDATSRRARLGSLLAALEAYGQPNPHGELDWGDDVGEEQF